MIGASHAGLPTVPSPVRNVWSENMAVWRSAFEAVGGFRLGFGKVGATSRPEDTDFCIRVGASAPDSAWLYVPAAVVEHDVPPGRSTFRFFLRRCFAEGAGKIELSAHLGDERDLGDERSYLTRTLPTAFVRDLAGGRIARAAAILAGVPLAAAGGASGLIKHARTGLKSASPHPAAASATPDGASARGKTGVGAAAPGQRGEGHPGAGAGRRRE